MRHLVTLMALSICALLHVMTLEGHAEAAQQCQTARGISGVICNIECKSAEIDPKEEYCKNYAEAIGIFCKKSSGLDEKKCKEQVRFAKNFCAEHAVRKKEACKIWSLIFRGANIQKKETVKNNRLMSGHVHTCPASSITARVVPTNFKAASASKCKLSVTIEKDNERQIFDGESLAGDGGEDKASKKARSVLPIATVKSNNTGQVGFSLSGEDCADDASLAFTAEVVLEVTGVDQCPPVVKRKRTRRSGYYWKYRKR